MDSPTDTYQCCKETHDGSAESGLRQFSLIHALINAYNRWSTTSLNKSIARHFLENIDRVDKLNVYQVAEECFTSRSGIRRFCQQIGFENFSDLKKHAWEFDLHRHFFESFAMHDDYRSYLTDKIISMLEDINETVKEEDLDELATLIYDAKRVVLIGSDFLSMSLRAFQHQMVVLHKIIDLLSDSEGDNGLLTQLDKYDLVIVISVSGSFAQAIQGDLANTCAARVLITQNPDLDMSDIFDWTIYISKERNEAGNTVYAEYGTRYFCDLLYNRYFFSQRIQKFDASKQ